MFLIKKDQGFSGDDRREFLVKALTAGAFAASGAMGLLAPARADLFGKIPRAVPRGRSFYSIEGDVRVNGRPAGENTFIHASDIIETGDKSQTIFVVGKDAFILHSNGRLQLSGSGILLDKLRLFTGRLLSVFGNREKREKKLVVTSSTATLGIRGTGVYLESEPDITYVCTCYGTVKLVANGNPEIQETITATRHDSPRYILAKGSDKKRLQTAPMKNHDDAELMLIEELVGRTPPFSLSDSTYNAPRRGY